MRRISICIVLAGVTCLLPANVHSEVQFRIPDPDNIQLLTMNDGSTLVGRVTEVGQMAIVFDGPVGKTTINKDRVRQIKEVSRSRVRDGKYWFANPNRSRLYLWPTGRTLSQGQGYIGDIYLFFPSVAYGVTNQFSIEGGLSLFPGVDLNNQIMYAIPKLGFRAARNLDLSIAAMIFRVVDDWDNGDAESVGLLCGTGTIGSEDYSLSVGAGYGFANGDWADKPAIMIGAEARVACRLALLSENWISPGIDDAIISYGCRFLGERVSVDLALFNTLNDNAVFPGIPFVGFVWNF